MMGSFIRLAAAAAFSALLAGCAGAPETAYPGTAYEGGAVVNPDSPLQCVPYVRAHSEIALRGDAYTWWDQAAGRYARTNSPAPGSVMVLHDYAGSERAHLAVVRAVSGPRDIRVDHANWLNDGAVYVDDPVRDVSLDNDWSEVRVYNLRTGAWGTKDYPVQGFIAPDSPDAGTVRMAQNPQAPAPHADQIGALIADDPDLEDENN